jgi:hypothetical protein
MTSPAHWKLKNEPTAPNLVAAAAAPAPMGDDDSDASSFAPTLSVASLSLHDKPSSGCGGAESSSAAVVSFSTTTSQSATSSSSSSPEVKSPHPLLSHGSGDGDGDLFGVFGSARGCGGGAFTERGVWGGGGGPSFGTGPLSPLTPLTGLDSGLGVDAGRGLGFMDLDTPGGSDASGFGRGALNSAAPGDHAALSSAPSTSFTTTTTTAVGGAGEMGGESSLGASFGPTGISDGRSLDDFEESLRENHDWFLMGIAGGPVGPVGGGSIGGDGLVDGFESSFLGYGEATLIAGSDADVAALPLSAGPFGTRPQQGHLQGQKQARQEHSVANSGSGCGDGLLESHESSHKKRATASVRAQVAASAVVEYDTMSSEGEDE